MSTTRALIRSEGEKYSTVKWVGPKWNNQLCPKLHLHLMNVFDLFLKLVLQINVSFLNIDVIHEIDSRNLRLLFSPEIGPDLGGIRDGDYFPVHDFYLNDFLSRLDNQYMVTFQALNKRGVEPVKLRTELPGLKIEAPSRVYVP